MNAWYMNATSTSIKYESIKTLRRYTEDVIHVLQDWTLNDILIRRSIVRD